MKRDETMIPPFEAFMSPILTVMANGEAYRNRELHALIASDAHFNFSESARNIMLPTGGILYKSRCDWALTYLYQAGLVKRLQRGIYQITEEGIKAHQSGKTVNVAYLKQYERFCHYLRRDRQVDASRNGSGDVEEKHTNKRGEGLVESGEKTPLESINSALNALEAELASTLLDEILQKDAYFFERLVMQLLVKMGYGKIAQSQVTTQSSDEGIDGIISSDRLGLDTIYVQAKRYAVENRISNGQIRDFMGALLQKGATKGIFITTSDFSAQAIRAVKENRHQTIALINGTRLTQLMIEYNLGVSIEETFYIKRLDSDFFHDDF